MIKETLAHLNLTVFAEIALGLFFFVFVVTAARVLTRPKAEMNRCADLPLKD
jgi:hypothetical protein